MIYVVNLKRMNNMEITLRAIFNEGPCGQKKDCKHGWDKAIKSLGTDWLDTIVTPMDILKHAGIRDAVWCLRVFGYKDYCLFNADMAEIVLHLFEDKFPGDKRPRKCIEGIRLYHDGEITDEELKQLKLNARYAGIAAFYSGGDPYSADDARAAANAAYYATYASARVTAGACVYCSDRGHEEDKKWQEIEEFYIKHFIENE